MKLEGGDQESDKWEIGEQKSKIEDQKIWIGEKKGGISWGWDQMGE